MYRQYTFSDQKQQKQRLKQKKQIQQVVRFGSSLLQSYLVDTHYLASQTLKPAGRQWGQSPVSLPFPQEPLSSPGTSCREAESPHHEGEISSDDVGERKRKRRHTE